jgi:hypothetical protein
MEAQVIPFYKTSLFWTATVTAIVSILVGMRYNQEAAALGVVAGDIIAYLVAAGIIQKTALQVDSNEKMQTRQMNHEATQDELDRQAYRSSSK